uniref:Tyrosine-protein phosphatase n=1 Tax=Ciona intestinalis TaxID=7719 RepID=Q9NDP4_CIOIN|nr:tyrosine phosphatase [Ciona intestinalis]BAB00633.1 tyrosine phosphatase [Ciona intestinalis]|eukprot:NP_001027610.1 tyrosine phosphatase [Ciona intestinalis]
MSAVKEVSPAVSRNLLTGSGTYNVREPAKEKKQSSVNISVVLLDHTEVVFKVNKRDRGQVLLDLVFQHLRVTEIKFFGLQFPNDVPDTMRWLDPTKSIRKQFKRGYPYILFFRVKFYATDLSTMKDEFTRYQLFMQIKLDLLERRLKCSLSEAASIAALAVQSELGDFNSAEHKKNYVAEFRFIPNQTEEFEAQVIHLHKMHRGLSPSQAEYYFIKKSQKLEMYGIEMHRAKDNDEEDLDVGVTSTGMLLYQNGFKKNEFRWSSIVKISFKRKQFYVQLRSAAKKEVNAIEPIHSFHMENYRACKRLWKSCVDFHSFYRLDRCMSRSCGHQHVANDGLPEQEDEMARQEKHLFSYLTLGGRGKGRENDESTDDLTQRQRYLRTRAASTKSKDNMSLACNGESRNEDKAPRRLSAPPSVSIGVGESGMTDEQMMVMLHQQQASMQSAHSQPKLFVNANYESNNNSEIPPPVKIPIQYHTGDPALTASYRTIHIRPETAGEADETAASELSVLTTGSETSSVLTSLTEKSYILPNPVPFPHQSSGQMNGVPDDLVIIRIKPDLEGRYGFNVKGGADQNMPILVSKVAAGSPAAMCTPALNEGDEVLQINGRDISSHSHEQVVRFIRSTREHHTGHLVLIVRPQNQADEDEVEVSTDDVGEVVGADDDEGALLERSMQWLEDMLDSGQILAMFDALYRKKPGATMNDARLPQNVTKNRYRDISPYDSTRVILNGIVDTDYINANYVNMFIPGNNWTNRYIACQGPLPNTSFDFWEMVWEQKSTLIVMLTTVVERGRPKCHQYWPDGGTSVQFGPFIIESVTEEVTPSFAFRDFKLYKCNEDAEVNGNDLTKGRDIRQMQYIAWPDHGVPDDSSDFLDFVLRVRQNRVGMAIPSTVHCSAGIGRTGVLITMETAMCLIEANQPVYPIEIARAMRDQRAMMIQTPSQFKFVCDAILRVYKEGLARPIYYDDYDEADSSADETNIIIKKSLQT